MALQYKEYKLNLEFLDSDVILNDDFKFGAFVSGKDGNGVIGLVFVEQTNTYIKYKLLYTNGSEDFLTIPTGVPLGYLQYIKSTYYEFPAIGNTDTLYIAMNEGKTYTWDEEGMKYVIIGSDYTKIQFINGGTSNE